MKHTKRLNLSLNECLIFSGLLIMLTSCDLNSNKTTPKSQELVIKDSIKYINKCYYSAMIYDTLLVLLSDCDSNYFHVFNKYTLKPIIHFGRKGKGPEDFSTPFPFKTNSITKLNHGEVEYYNLNSPLIAKIDFNKANLEDGRSSYITSKIIDEELYANMELNKISENFIAGIELGSPDGLFFIYDKRTKEKKWIEYLPKLEDIYNEFRLVYLGSLCSNLTTLAFANKFFDQISFYNSDGIIFKKYSFSENEKPRLNLYSKTIEPSSKIYFAKSYGTNDHYYVSRLNYSMDSVISNKFLPSSILQFDWQGNILNHYLLQTIPDCFCVDESSKILYAVERVKYNDEYIYIKRYNL